MNMEKQHPNIVLLEKLDPGNISEASEILSEDVIWHFFNPMLPEMAGDYTGMEGIDDFFNKLRGITEGSFTVNPIMATPVGDELVVMHTQNSFILNEDQMRFDVVLVWRIVDYKVVEVWDIPSVYTNIE